MEDLVYQRELWSKRAAVARECGEELGLLNAQIRRVLTRNYFGQGCVEGIAVYTQLTALINSGAESIARLAGRSAVLAAAADRASAEIEAADKESGETLD